MKKMIASMAFAAALAMGSAAVYAQGSGGGSGSSSGGSAGASSGTGTGTGTATGTGVGTAGGSTVPGVSTPGVDNSTGTRALTPGTRVPGQPAPPNAGPAYPDTRPMLNPPGATTTGRPQ